jgi:DnaK suppressor protein
MNLDIQKNKDILEAELKRLEKEILEVAEKESDSTWEAVQTETGEDAADRGDVAGSIENYESNFSIASDLEKEIIDIKDALAKIESNTYGKCEICQGEIEIERLEANPEARTCELHMN